MPASLSDLPDAMTLEEKTPYPLQEAAKRFFPLGGVTKTTLRDAIARGELSAERIGRQYFVTAEYIAKWREHCRVKPKVPGSGSDQPPTGGPRPGTSKTASDPQGGDKQQAAARTIFEGQNAP